MFASTSTLALLALLALTQLAAPVDCVRSLKQQSLDEINQAAREAAQLAAQVAQLQALIANGNQQQANQAASNDQQAFLAAQARAAAREARRARRAAARARREAQRLAQLQAQQQQQQQQGGNNNGPNNNNNNGPDNNPPGDNSDDTPDFRNIRSTYHYYAPQYYTSSLYCADAFAPLLNAGRGGELLARPWTAYCIGADPMSPDKCGQCIRITNPATGQSVELTVVDMCGNGGLDIDPLGFNAVDGDGAGVRDGHMMLDVEWC